jgi:hypothetical protein
MSAVCWCVPWGPLPTIPFSADSLQIFQIFLDWPLWSCSQTKGPKKGLSKKLLLKSIDPVNHNPFTLYFNSSIGTVKPGLKRERVRKQEREKGGEKERCL